MRQRYPKFKLQAARASGAEIRTGEPVHDLQPPGNGDTVQVDTASFQYSADQVRPLQKRSWAWVVATI